MRTAIVDSLRIAGHSASLEVATRWAQVLGRVDDRALVAAARRACSLGVDSEANLAAICRDLGVDFAPPPATTAAAAKPHGRFARAGIARADPAPTESAPAFEVSRGDVYRDLADDEC